MKPENRAAGNMHGREDAIRAEKCVAPPAGCGRQMYHKEISTWSILTQKEYQQSGWCNTCQNQVFGDPEQDGCTCDNPCCEVDVGGDDVGQWIIDCGSYHCPEHGEAAKQARNEAHTSDVNTTTQE